MVVICTIFSRLYQSANWLSSTAIEIDRSVQTWIPKEINASLVIARHKCITQDQVIIIISTVESKTKLCIYNTTQPICLVVTEYAKARSGLSRICKRRRAACQPDPFSQGYKKVPIKLHKCDFAVAANRLFCW